MEATRRWLNSDAADAYSVQLMVAGSDEQLRNNLKALPKFVEINDIYMYRREAYGRPMINVLWGSFQSRQEAQDELDELPRSWRASRPYVRTLSSIRAELSRISASRRR